MEMNSAEIKYRGTPFEQTKGILRRAPIVIEGEQKYGLNHVEFQGFTLQSRRDLLKTEWQADLPKSVRVREKDLNAKTLPYQAVYGSNPDAQDKPIFVSNSGSWETSASLAGYAKELLDSGMFSTVIILDATVSRGISGAHLPKDFPNRKQQGLQMAELIRQITDQDQFKGKKMIASGISLGGDEQLNTMMYLDAMHKSDMANPNLAALIHQHAARVSGQNVVSFVVGDVKGSAWKRENEMLMEDILNQAHLPPEEQKQLERLKSILDTEGAQPDIRIDTLRKMASEYQTTTNSQTRDDIRKKITGILQPIIGEITADLDLRHNDFKVFARAAWPWIFRLLRVVQPAPFDVREYFTCAFGVVTGKNDDFFPARQIENYIDNQWSWSGPNSTVSGLDAMYPNTSRRHALYLDDAPHLSPYTMTSRAIKLELLPMLQVLMPEDYPLAA